MANRGAGTNGSSSSSPPRRPHHLDGKHTIFGEVVSGYDVVETISKVTSDDADGRPTEPVNVVLESLQMSDKPPRPVEDPASDERTTTMG